MTKEMTSAEKCRKTKLSKKSVEELIDIIVRKDDVERRKDKLISCLKTNIAGLEKKISSLQSNIDNNESTIVLLDSDNTELKKRVDDVIANNKILSAENKHYDETITSLQKSLSKALVADTKCFVLGGIIVFIIMMIIRFI